MSEGRVIDLSKLHKGSNVIALNEEQPQIDSFITTTEERREYNEKNQIIKLFNSMSGISVIFEYDENGNNTKKIFSDGSIAIMTYNKNKKLLTLIDSRGYSEECIYDINDNLINIKRSWDTRIFGQNLQF